MLRRPVPVPLCSSRCKQTRCALVGGFVQIPALQQELLVSEAIHCEHQLYMFPCAVQVPALEQELLVSLLPKDQNDARGVVLEVRRPAVLVVQSTTYRCS